MYQQRIERKKPGCILILLDRSDSMQRPWGRSGMTLAHGASLAINKVLLELGVKSTKKPGEPMLRYFDVGIFGYGLCPSNGTEGVESALTGLDGLGDRGIVPLPEIAIRPIAVREEPALDLGAPASRVPVWVEPVHGYRTPMCEAIAVAGQHVFDWVNQHPDSFPPIILNITDGLVTDSPYEGAGLADWATRLSSIATSDGPALLLNIFISPDAGAERWFPATPDGLPEPGPDLFAISSLMPEPMLRTARATGINVSAGARGFVCGAGLEALVKFLDIGTRLDVRD